MNSRVISNREIAPGYFHLTFEAAPETFCDAKPGQFVMIRASEGTDPLLRRPMSLSGCGGGSAEIVFKVFGAGTSLMAQKKVGDPFDVLGPFGNSFDPPSPIPGEAQSILLVAGGTGIAPLLFFAAQNSGRKIDAVIGGATATDILMEDSFNGHCDRVTVLTEDGSMGARGLATNPLGDYKDAYILACGPYGLLKAVDSFACDNGTRGELSMEERMGCGFGVCLGCMVETQDEKKRVCVDGPVFKTGELKWR